MIENRVFLDKVNDVSFIESGIKENDEIIKIDHVPVFNWLLTESQYVSSSTPAHDLERTLWNVFKSKFKGPRIYEVRTTNGVKTVKTDLDTPVDYSLLFDPNVPKVHTKVLNDSTGYISISLMTGNVVKEFSNALDSLRYLPNLIVDIRDNGGGNSDYSEQIARFLIDKPQKACVSRKKMIPNPNSYKGKLYVLLGVKTASAAESFALDLLESGKATLIGSSSAGDTGNGPNNFTTDYGISFRIPTRKPPQVSFKNFPMEGKGLVPHHEVTQTVIDYLNGIDTVLEFALKLIPSNSYD